MQHDKRVKIPVNLRIKRNKQQTTAELQAPDFRLALTECVYMFSKQLLVKCLDRMILFKRLGNVQEVLIIVNSDDTLRRDNNGWK